jgi:hypothetical protein
MRGEHEQIEPRAIMKSKLQLQSLASVVLLVLSIGAATAQNAPLPPRLIEPATPAIPRPPRFPYPTAIDPTTGLPVAPASAIPNMVVDPATGLPVAQPAPEWKDANWKDSGKVLPQVAYDGLPVSEVARDLSEQFTNQFDILLPQGWGEGRPNSGNTDWMSTSIYLRLKNVTASEVFNAMNLLFENNRTPLRWELKLNGRKQIALLRVLQDPQEAKLLRQPEIKRVYYVGNLIGDEKSGGMSMVEVIANIQDVWRMTYGNSASIRFHDKTQLLIVSGTDDQIIFIQQTLEALNSKVQGDRRRRQEAEHAAAIKAKFEEQESKAGGPK